MIGAMRAFLVALMAFGLAAASPATEESDRLLDAGDDAGAFQAVEAAAGVGDPEALHYLAWFYDNGRHVAQDKARAAALYRRAAQAGHALAQWRLGVMLDLGDGVPEDPVEAFDWIRRAAAQDSPEGHASLAVMHATGRGTPIDFAASMRHYRRAAVLGHSAGLFGVGVLHVRGEGVPVDRIEGAAWLLAALVREDERAQAALRELRLSRHEMRSVVARANAILNEHGQAGSIELRDDTAVQPVPVT